MKGVELQVLKERNCGYGILVSSVAKESSAAYSLRDPSEVQTLITLETKHLQILSDLFSHFWACAWTNQVYNIWLEVGEWYGNAGDGVSEVTGDMEEVKCFMNMKRELAA